MALSERRSSKNAIIGFVSGQTSGRFNFWPFPQKIPIKKFLAGIRTSALLTVRGYTISHYQLGHPRTYGKCWVLSGFSLLVSGVLELVRCRNFCLFWVEILLLENKNFMRFKLQEYNLLFPCPMSYLLFSCFRDFGENIFHNFLPVGLGFGLTGLALHNADSSSTSLLRHLHHYPIFLSQCLPSSSSPHFWQTTTSIHRWPCMGRGN